MTAIDHVSQRADPLPGFVFKPDRTHHFAIDVGGLLAAAQIFHGAVALLRRDPERDAAAGAAAVEPEHEAGLFRGPAMVERIDAQRAVLADQPRRDLLDELEARPPHQRAIAEHPEIAFGHFRFGRDFRWHRARPSRIPRSLKIRQLDYRRLDRLIDKITGQRSPHVRYDPRAAPAPALAPFDHARPAADRRRGVERVLVLFGLPGRWCSRRLARAGGEVRPGLRLRQALGGRLPVPPRGPLR